MTLNGCKQPPPTPPKAKREVCQPAPFHTVWVQTLLEVRLWLSFPPWNARRWCRIAEFPKATIGVNRVEWNIEITMKSAARDLFWSEVNQSPSLQHLLCLSILFTHSNIRTNLKLCSSVHVCKILLKRASKLAKFQVTYWLLWSYSLPTSGW